MNNNEFNLYHFIIIIIMLDSGCGRFGNDALSAPNHFLVLAYSYCCNNIYQYILHSHNRLLAIPVLYSIFEISDDAKISLIWIPKLLPIIVSEHNTFDHFSMIISALQNTKFVSVSAFTTMSITLWQFSTLCPLSIIKWFFT